MALNLLYKGMRLYLLFISIFTLSTLAQSRHIVLDLNGLLVQGIPSSKVASVTKQNVLTVTTDRTTYFVPRNNLSIFIEKLVNDKNIISIHSTLTASITSLILKQIIVKGIDLETLIKGNLGSITYGNSLDLKSITSDDNIIFFTSNDSISVVPTDKKVLIDSLYYYDTFDLMKAEYDALEAAGYLDSHKDFVTKDESVYENEYYKLSKIYYSLLKSDNGQNILSTITKSSTLTKAKVLANNEFKEFEYTVKGGSCYQENLITGAKSWSKMETCIETLGAKLKWHGKTCAYVKDGAIFQTLSMSKCVNELHVSYVWKGKYKRDCYAFAGNLKLNVPRSKCSNSYVISHKNKLNFINSLEDLSKYSDKEIIEKFLDYKSKFSLKNYNEKKKTISGVQFPRTNSLLWRTMGKSQYDYTKGILAMFGDHTQNVESKTFTHIKLLVSGEKSPFGSLKLEPFLKTALDDQLKLGLLPKTQAVIFTEKLLDDFFAQRDFQENEDKLVNYRAAKYIDWNPRAIFAALSPATCHIYGHPIMVSFKQMNDRSVDLNYWNYVRNSVWSDYTADIGEFLIPSHVEASDIESVLGISSGVIHSAFMKSYYNGETILLGFRGPNKPCLIRNNRDNKIYTCITPDYGNYVVNDQAPVSVGTDVVKPQFIVRLCPKDGECKSDQAMFDYFDVKEDYKLEQSYLDILNNIEIHGQRPRVFYSPDSVAN